MEIPTDCFTFFVQIVLRKFLMIILITCKKNVLEKVYVVYRCIFPAMLISYTGIYFLLPLWFG